MRIAALRHPMLALLGAVSLLGFAAGDALGIRACVHHTAALAGDAVHASEHDPGAHHSAGPHESGGPHEHGDDSAWHSQDHLDDGHHTSHHDGDPHSHSDCDCGFLCVGMSGPPPLEPARVHLLDGEPLPPATIPALRVEDAREPPCRIPHFLPFSQGPPPLI